MSTAEHTTNVAEMGLRIPWVEDKVINIMTRNFWRNQYSNCRSALMTAIRRNK